MCALGMKLFLDTKVIWFYFSGAAANCKYPFSVSAAQTKITGKYMAYEAAEIIRFTFSWLVRTACSWILLAFCLLLNSCPHLNLSAPLLPPLVASALGLIPVHVPITPFHSSPLLLHPSGDNIEICYSTAYWDLLSNLLILPEEVNITTNSGYLEWEVSDQCQN